MGSELQLTGLASGFDWSPVVDQLIELERIPQKRLISEKERNQEKISDLDLLKSQLDSLNGASRALQDEDLFQSRKISYADSNLGFSASAAAGAITGDFQVTVRSLATRTEMSSANRSNVKLGAGIDPNVSLRNLPLHTEITEGTFTISGRTFNISNLDMTLQDLLDKINANVSSLPGVNPESDHSAITVEYDSALDKIVIDSGEKSPGVTNNAPVLGSSTDTSNFLSAMRLLSRHSELVDADIEANSGVSLFNPGDGLKSWLHSTDRSSSISPGDSRSYASFGGKLYERISKEPTFDSAAVYYTGDEVYNQGFLYRSISDLPSQNWDGSQVNLGDKVKASGKSFELLADLDSLKIDDFSSVDLGNHLVTQPTSMAGTGATNAYKAGDIVKGADGSFFRALQDRTIAGSVDWSGYGFPGGLPGSVTSHAWAGNIPPSVHIQGRAYELNPAVTATSHGGTSDTTIYSSSNGWGGELDLIFGQNGVAGAEGNYFTPISSSWDQVQAFSATDSYQAGDVVLSGGQFLQANSSIAAGPFNPADWTDVTSSINDLGNAGSGGMVDNFWQKIDMSVANNVYWNEFAHANGRNDYDHEFWQEVAPEMKRFDSTGSGQMLEAIDYSLWAHVGSVGSGNGDGTFGNRDSLENGFPSDSNFTYDSWGGSANANDYVLHGGKVFLARINTVNEPGTPAGQNDWHLIADSNTMVATSVTEQANKSRFTDSDYWIQFEVPAPDEGSGHWAVVKERLLTSSQTLGNLDMSVSLASANFAAGFTGLTSGLGNFFIGEGEGTVRIDYDVNKDSLSDLIDRVNSSEANIDMYYDPVSDRFVLKNKNSGSIGMVLHESPSWDTLSSANVGAGNILALMGLAAPTSITDDYDSTAVYDRGDYVRLTVGSETTYWQSDVDSPIDFPAVASNEWRQVIQGVGRSLEEELGANSIVEVNGGEKIYSTETSFSDTEHGYEGISFDVSNVSIGGSVRFSVSKDTSAAKKAIDKFVEEFNDAQDYIKSLVSVTNDGENVTAGRFSSNLEISRLGSRLRKVVFGDSTPHSQSGTTTDGSDLIINTNDGSNTEINAIASQLNLGTSETGYVIKVINDNSSGQTAFYRWNGTDWDNSDPTYSSFRLANIGLDFGIGSDNIQVVNSAKLIQALQDEPEKVQSLFADETENAFDLNTNTTRKYEGISYALDDFISSFLTGDSGTGYKGAYTTHIESIKSQNERLDDRIEDLENYLEQREETLRAGFMRMEEMQSKINTQMQTLQSSFNNKK